MAQEPLTSKYRPSYLPSPTKPFRFFDLPRELRDLIYEHTVGPENNRIVDPEDEHMVQYKYDLRLYRASKQLYEEAQRVFRLKNIFARVETPWDEAQEHVRIEGMIPVVLAGEAAAKFNHIHVRIVIDAPFHGPWEREKRRFVVFVDDLERFTRMWMFSDLFYAGDLNPHLRLELYLRNPSAPESEEYVKLGRELQRRILLPFRQVKNLRDLTVEMEDSKASIDADIEKQMRDQMAIPYTSARECLERAQSLKEEGDRLAIGMHPKDSVNNLPADPDHKAAIAKYISAFEAMHIICIKRKRSVWADAWFDRFIDSGRFEGKHGQAVRLILRIELVAAITKAHYHLGTLAPKTRPSPAEISEAETEAPYTKVEYFDESRFWGMRTIDILRDQVSPNDEVHDNFPMPGRPSVANVYLYTGLSMRELSRLVPMELSDCMGGRGDERMKSESKRLLRAARRWGRGDKDLMGIVDGVALDF